MDNGVHTQLFHQEDILLVPIYFIFILVFAFVIRNVKYGSSPLKPYFMPALTLKLLGGIAVGLVYDYYYNEGDTVYYWADARAFYAAAQHSLSDVVRLLFLPAGVVSIATYQYTWWLTYFHDSTTWTTVKIIGLTSLISFDSYPVESMFVSLLSFTGVWALYKTFVDLIPRLNKQFAFAILFVPSVFFWGSGILKDSVTFGCLGWITYCSYRVFFKGEKVTSNLLMLAFVGYLALQIKAYIVISFVPALMFWIFLTYRKRIQNQFIRVLLGPVVLILSMFSGAILVRKITEEYSEFSIRNVLETANTFQTWHTYLAENESASGYSLGAVNIHSWPNILSKFPLAVNVTLFRPYLWEAHSPVMFLSALESLGILLFTLYIFKQNGIINILKAIVSNPTVFFCIFFSLFFAYAVGFTSYNFGALVRYKIPCIPFFLIGLIILNDATRESRLSKQSLKQWKKKFIADSMMKSADGTPS